MAGRDYGFGWPTHRLKQRRKARMRRFVLRQLTVEMKKELGRGVCQ